MKKLANYFLSFLMLISLIVPFIPSKVYAMASSFTYAYVDATGLSFRTCASYNCSLLKDREGDDIYLNRPRTVEVIGYEGSWAKIRISFWGYEYEGFVAKEYLGNIKTYTLDQNYANGLRSKGFPESYIEKLCKLHAVHPNWNFEVVNTGVGLDEAVNAEYSTIYRNLTSTTDYSMRSSDPAAYVNGSYIQFEPGWYAASRSALKYYLDPRNFLDENSIFMFEQLSFSDISEETVQRMLNGTFMAGSFTYNGQNYTYARAIIEAGRSKNVNPAHLVARIIQEQGASGSGTANMDGGDGKIYHNYFNFGASGSNWDQIFAGALSYAKASGWDNPYTALVGAAEDLSNGYISCGQDTIYLQKFDVVGDDKYWHQYMANIQAPYAESYRIYKSYWESNIVDNSYTFKIPVFSDMGGSTAISVLSNNNNLSNLTFNTGSLYPAFDSSITTYTLEVGSNVNSVNISAKAAHDKAKIEGTGDVTLSSSSTKKDIIVTAEDGSKRTYTITINKKEASKETPEDVIRYAGYKQSGNNVSGFNIGTSVDSAIKSIKNRYQSAEVKMYDASNKEITNGTLSTGQKLSIKVNNVEKKFDVIIYGDTNGDGKIGISDYAKICDTILGKTSMTGAYNVAADTNHDGKIGIGDYAKVKDYILGTLNRLE